jgi:hypothetical protein
MGGLAPGLGSVSGSPDPLCGHTSWLCFFGECYSSLFCWICLLWWGARSWDRDDVSHFLGGSCQGRCSRVMTRGLEMRVLDGVNTWSLAGFGCGTFCRGPLHWIYSWGLYMGSIHGLSHW